MLKDGIGKHHTIAQDDIEVMQAGKASMMPDLKNQLTVKEIASLLAFLHEKEMQ